MEGRHELCADWNDYRLNHDGHERCGNLDGDDAEHSAICRDGLPRSGHPQLDRERVGYELRNNRNGQRCIECIPRADWNTHSSDRLYRDKHKPDRYDSFCSSAIPYGVPMHLYCDGYFSRNIC